MCQTAESVPDIRNPLGSKELGKLKGCFQYSYNSWHELLLPEFIPSSWRAPYTGQLCVAQGEHQCCHLMLWDSLSSQRELPLWHNHYDQKVGRNSQNKWTLKIQLRYVGTSCSGSLIWSLNWKHNWETWCYLSLHATGIVLVEYKAGQNSRW